MLFIPESDPRSPSPRNDAMQIREPLSCLSPMSCSGFRLPRDIGMA